MNKRMVMLFALVAVLTGAGGIPRAAAQETAKEGEVQAKPMDSYNVEFTVSEMNNGKKVNSRSYSMQVRADAQPKWTDTRRLRVGSQVPVPMPQANNTLHYKDVGMDIDCRLMPIGGDKVGISTVWGYTSLASNLGHENEAPVIRNVHAEVETIVTLGKPTVISEVDDVGSTAHYVFEVKVTKITP